MFQRLLLILIPSILVLGVFISQQADAEDCIKIGNDWICDQNTEILQVGREQIVIELDGEGEAERCFGVSRVYSCDSNVGLFQFDSELLVIDRNDRLEGNSRSNSGFLNSLDPRARAKVNAMSPGEVQRSLRALAGDCYSRDIKKIYECEIRKMTGDSYSGDVLKTQNRIIRKNLKKLNSGHCYSEDIVKMQNCLIRETLKSMN